LNAVLNKNTADVKDCTIYVALFPCNECAKVIVQSGISEVVYACDKNAHKQEFIASRRLLEMAGIKLTLVPQSVINKCYSNYKEASYSHYLSGDNVYVILGSIAVC